MQPVRRQLVAVCNHRAGLARPPGAGAAQLRIRPFLEQGEFFDYELAKIQGKCNYE